MAISFVGASSLTTVPSTFTISAPSGVVSGDYQLVIIASATASESITSVPSGWTLVASHLATGASDSFSTFVYESTTDTGSAQFTRSSSARGGHVVRVAYSGVASDSGGTVTGYLGAGTSRAIPQQTTSTSGSWVVAAIHTDGVSGMTFTAPTNWTERYEFTTTAEEFQGLCVADYAPASTGTVTGNFTQSASDTEANVFSIVLVPAASTTTVTASAISIDVSIPNPTVSSSAGSATVGAATISRAVALTTPGITTGGTPGQITYVGHTSNVAVGTSFTLASPAGLQPGDRQFIFVGSPTSSDSISPPDGDWTQVAFGVNTGGDSHQFIVFTSTTETGTATVTRTSARIAHAIRMAWRNVDSISAGTAQVTSSGTTHTLPTQTPASSNSVVVGAVHTDNVASQVFTSPSGWSERYNVNNADTEPQAIAIADVTGSAGTPIAGSFGASTPDEAIVFSITMAPAAAQSSPDTVTPATITGSTNIYSGTTVNLGGSTQAIPQTIPFTIGAGGTTSLLLTTTIPTPSIVQTPYIFPTTIAGTSTVPEPTVIEDNSTTVSAFTVYGVATFGTRTITADTGPIPATVSASTTAGAVTIGINLHRTVEAVTLARSVSIGPHTFIAGIGRTIAVTTITPRSVVFGFMSQYEWADDPEAEFVTLESVANIINKEQFVDIVKSTGAVIEPSSANVINGEQYADVKNNEQLGDIKHNEQYGDILLVEEVW